MPSQRMLFALIYLLLLFLPLSEAFQFGVSDFVSPPTLGPPRSFAVVDVSARITASLRTDDDDFFGSLHLTLTLPFANNTEMPGAQYVLTRRVQPNGDGQWYDDVFVTADSQLWTLLTRNDPYSYAVAISMTNCSVMHTIALNPNGTSPRGWAMATHTNGLPCPVVCEGDPFLNTSVCAWHLPNATHATVSLTSPSCAWTVISPPPSSASPPFLYSVTSSISDNITLISATAVNLADASTANSSLSLTSSCNYDFTGCAVPLDASNSSSPIAFLTLCLQSTQGSVILLDPITMTLSASPVAVSGGFLPYGQLRCGATAVRSQFLVWVSVTDGVTFFLLDLQAETLAPISIPRPEGYAWIDAHTTGSGSAVLCACDGTYQFHDTVSEYRYYFYDAFNASDLAHYDAMVSVGAIMVPAFTGVVEREGEVLLVMEDLKSTSLQAAFLVYNSSTPDEIDAYVTITSDVTALPVRFAESIELDDQLRVFIPVPFWWSAPALLLVFEWYNPTSLLAAGSLYALRNLTANPSVQEVTKIYARGNRLTLTTMIRAPALYGVTQLSIPDMTLISNILTKYFITQLLFRSGAPVIGLAETGMVEFDSTLTNITRIWPLPFTTFGTVGGLISASSDTIYAFYVADVFTCAVLSPSALNSTLSFRLANNSDLNNTGIAVATLVANNIYLSSATDPVRMYRFDLNCWLQEAYNTGLEGDAHAFPMYYAQDKLYVGRSPLFTPVYLDCGLGSFRNLTSGTCEPCPNGSANSLPDTQACQPCPTRTAPNSARASCVCSAGFYSPTNDQDCLDCPVGGVCPGDNLVIPARNYWRCDASSDDFYECPFPDACNGSDVCARGYAGPLCAVCAPHFALVIDECRLCTSSAAAVGFWILAALVYVAIFAALLYSGGSSFSVLKSFISFAQIVTFPTSGPVPHLLRNPLTFVVRLFSLANLQLLSLASPDCVLGRHLTYPVTIVASAAVPIVLILLIILLFRIPWSRLCARFLAKKSIAKSDPFNEERGFADRVDMYARTGTPLRVAIFVVLLTSPSSTQQLASFYTCRSVADVLYLVRDYAVRCHSALYAAFIAPVSLLFAVYALGVPIGFFVLLYRYRQTLDLRVLHGSYTERYYYWDSVEQLRKILLLLCNAVLAPRLPAFFGPCSLFISIAALCVHFRCNPYNSARNFWFQTADLSGVCLFFLWFVSNDGSAADALAWIYWLFAMCYAAASLCVLLYPLLAKLFRLVQRCRKGYGADVEIDSELDPLFPKAKQ